MHDRCGLKRGKGYVLRRESWGTNGVGRRVGVCKRDGEKGLCASIDAGGYGWEFI